MNKKIKIIELYNLIANEEKIPKKIKYRGEVYHHNVFKTNYYRDDNGSSLSYINLNDEAKILEDNTEEIEELKLKYRDTNYFNMLSEEAKVKWLFKYIQEDEDKINELVRTVKQIRKDIKNG